MVLRRFNDISNRGFMIDHDIVTFVKKSSLNPICPKGTVPVSSNLLYSIFICL